VPEEAPKEVTQALGVIPNAYFDLIARVMPGCLFLFAMGRLSRKNPVSVLTDAFIPYGELRGSTSAWLIVTVVAAYILGHAFSPIVRFLEQGPEGTDVRRRSDPQKIGLRRYLLPPFWTCPEATKEECKKVQASYNRLRSQNPSVAALAIRIRAEYTMYGGLLRQCWLSSL
jgi:hypothetical protein